MRITLKFSSALLPLFLLACSNQETYTVIQRYEQNECLMLPRPQQKECMDHNSDSYEEYQRKRKEVLEGTGTDG